MARATPADKIKALGDPQALLVLRAYSEKYLKKRAAETKLTADMKKAMNGYLKKEGSTEGPAAPLSDSEVARRALLLLASDERRAKPIMVLVEASLEQQKGKKPKKGSAASKEAGMSELQLESLTIGTVALVTAAIIALQTHVSFDRDKDGKVSLHVEKKPTEDGLITPIIRRILGLV